MQLVLQRLLNLPAQRAPDGACLLLCCVLFCFFGCSPAQPPEPGQLAYHQALQAKAQGLSIRTQELLETAIAQGSSIAVDEWLSLTQADLGPVTQQQRLAQLGHTQLTALQYQRLGLWQASAAINGSVNSWQALAADRTPDLKSLRKASCQLTVQPVLSSLLSIQQWQQWLRAWPQSPMGQLNICFDSPMLLDMAQLACSEQRKQRIQCDTKALWPLALQSDARLMLVLAGRGGASFNNGLLILPEQASLALLQHELSHAFGFLDEYAYDEHKAKRECIIGRISTNLIFSRADLKDYLASWQLSAAEIALTPIPTCNSIGLQAYKPVAVSSHMQHFELEIPPLYLKLMHQQLAKASEITPVSYYFAYQAERALQFKEQRTLLQHAARRGYLPAEQQLSAWQ